MSMFQKRPLSTRAVMISFCYTVGRNNWILKGVNIFFKCEMRGMVVFFYHKYF